MFMGAMRAKPITSHSILFAIFILASFSLSCRLASDLAGRLRSTEPQSAPAGLIAYVGSDGNIYTIDRNGENQAAITQDASPQLPEGEDSLVYRYPTWVLDGEQLVFVELRNIG